MDLQQAQQDYQLIEGVITWMREHCREQPSLSDMAAIAGLHESDFQRLFIRWAGVGPNRFIQYLTLEHARTVMCDSAGVLSVGLDSGQHGPEHKHDLFVSLKTVSPGEFKRRTAGLRIEFGQIATPFGRAVIGFTVQGVCHLSFLRSDGQAEERLRSAWPNAQLRANTEAAQALGEHIFSLADSPSPQPVSGWVMGSNFQIQVWRALLALPSGHLCSYGELARRTGHPGAARAVGTAMANNPLAYLIPCHRVLRASGEMGVYHWGDERKAAMVAWEAARRSGAG